MIQQAMTHGGPSIGAVGLAPPTSDLEPPARVLVVDDAASTRRFLRGVLDYCPQFDVVGEADNGRTAIELAEAVQPDVILLDVSMPVVDGPSALRGLLRAAPNTRVIILSGTDERGARPLLDAGATAFVAKGLLPFELLERLGSILGRRVTFPPASPADETPPPAPALEPLQRVQTRAVICDDDATSRRLVAQVLASCDVAVIAETDLVPSLLSLVELSRPELVILDLWLEGTTGTSALPEIRKISPDTLVVAYSAHAVWKDDALAAGAAAFVAKPHFDELAAAINRLAPHPVV
jgi:DNA-binding NarL/FixJ family response regulator